MPNESAFPINQNDETTGMSLRDYFAAKAIRVCEWYDSEEYTDSRALNKGSAKKCYAIADAMLKARESNA